jgi:hypothetical protein
MPAGRPQGSDLDPEILLPVAQEVVTIDARGRVRIPAWVVTGVGWLDSYSDGKRYALGIFDEPGRIELRSWDENAASVVAQRRELGKAKNYRAVRLLEDRYRKVEIPKDLRPSLGDSSVAHLGLPPDRESHVYIFRTEDIVEIVAPTYRDKVLADARQMFTGVL